MVGVLGLSECLVGGRGGGGGGGGKDGAAETSAKLSSLAGECDARSEDTSDNADDELWLVLMYLCGDREAGEDAAVKPSCCVVECN